MKTEEQIKEKALQMAMDWVFTYTGDRYTNEEIMDILYENKLRVDVAQDLFSEYEEPTICATYEYHSPEALHEALVNFSNDIIQFYKELSL